MKNLQENKRVLFLSLSGIGNLLMQLPAIEALKKSHPSWHIALWVAPRGTKELAQAQPFIDEVLEMPIKASIVQHMQNILTLRKKQFDIAIVLSPGQLMKSAAYLKLSGIPVRIGNTYPYKGEKESGRFLTDPVSEDSSLHDIEQNLKLLEPLKINPSPISHYTITIPEESIMGTSSSPLLTKERLGEVNYVGIHAGSAKNFAWKRWPLERFATLTKMLQKKNPDTHFLIFGGPDEQEDTARLVNLIGSQAQAISAPLLTTAAIIQQHCKLFISNDSGLMHIAAATGVPTIGLFGPTDEKQTGPRGQKSIAVRAPGTTPVYNTETAYDFGTKPHESLLALTPEIVIDKTSDFFV